MALHLLQHARSGQLNALIHIQQSRIHRNARIQHRVQLHRDLGIFCRIARSLLDVHLLKADLRSAFSRHLFIGDGAPLQVAQRQGIHAVGAMRLQHIRLQQRVMRHTRQPDAMVFQDMHVVLQVLTHLGVVGTFHPATQACEHMLARQLIGSTRITVRKRHVTGLARLDR